MSDKKMDGLIINIEASTQGLEQGLQRGERAVSSATIRITSDLSRMDKGMADLESRAKSVGGGLTGLSATVRAVTSTLAAGFSFSEIVKAIDAWTNFENRLKLVGLTGQHLASSMEEVYRVSQLTSQNIDSTASIYQRFAQNNDKLGLSQAELARTTETVSKAVAISGSSSESAKAAMMQFGQAMASGVLRGEEFNSVNEQANGVIMALAQGLGVTTGQLRLMANEGQLTADVVIKGLGKSAEFVDQKFATMQKTISMGVVEVDNAFTKLVGSFAAAEGANTALYTALSSLSSVMDALSADSETFGHIIDAAFALAAGKAVAALTGLTAQQIKSAAATKAATLATEEKAQADQRAAVSANLQAKAELERAKLAVAAAEAEVAANRAREVANIKGLQSVQAALNAELTLEQQRHQAQISEQGRQLSVARMAELRLAEVAIVKQLTAAEAQLASTTVAASASVAAAQEERAVAAGHAAATQQALNVATVTATTESRAAAAANSILATSFAAVRAAGAGLMSLLSGPVGLIVTAGLVAASFIDWGKSTDEVIAKLGDLKAPLKLVIDQFKELNQDQRAASLTKWADAQVASAQKVTDEYKKLRTAVGESLQPTGFGKEYGQQLDRNVELLKQLDDAKEKGESLTPVLERIAATTGVPDKNIATWKTYAGDVADAVQVNRQVSERQAALNAEMAKGVQVVETQNKSVTGLTIGGEAYLNTLKKKHKEEIINNDVVKEAIQWIEDHKDASEEDKKQILAEANAIKKQEDANKSATKAESEATKSTKKHADEITRKNKAIADYVAESEKDIATSQRMAEAYLKGGDAIRQATQQAQIENEVLKLGAQARGQVTEQVKALADARDREALSKSIDDLRTENAQMASLAAVTLQGAEAITEYNVRKDLAAALSGKNAQAVAVESSEMEALIRQHYEYKDQLDALSRVEGIMNRLYPEREAMDNYRSDLMAINEAMGKYPERAGEYEQAIYKLNAEYATGGQQVSEWQQLTERALDSIDEGFSSLWKSAFTGFENFSDSLKNSFLNLLAELAHAAITRPILLNMGTSLGFGGLMSGGSSGGGIGLMDMASGANAMANSSVFSQLWSGFQQQGLSGAWSALDGWAGNAYGSLTQPGLVGPYGTLSQQFGGTSLGALTPWLSIGGGALAGYSQGGLGGAAVGAGSAYAGQAIGTAIGGPIGGISGGIIGSALGGLVGGGIFGGSGARFPSLYTSAGGYYDNGKYTATGTPEQLAGEKMFGTELDSYMSSVNQKFSSALGGLYEMFGDAADVTTDIYARLRQTSGKIAGDIWTTIDGESFHRFSSYGGDAKDIQGQLAQFADDVLGQFLAEAITISDSLPEHLREQFTGLAASADTTAQDVSDLINEIIGRFDAVNAALEMVGIKALETSNAGLIASDNIAALSGGYEQLTTNVQAFYESFVPESEKIQATLDAVPKAFEDLNIHLPDTRAAYREMAKDIDVTTESGQAMFASFMSMASSADAYYDILEQKAANLLAMEQSFYSTFTPKGVQNNNLLKSVTDLSHSLGISLPNTRYEFSQLVNAMDKTSASGKNLYETILSNQSAFDSYYTLIEEQSQQSVDNINTLFDQLKTAISTQLDELKSQYDQQLSDLKTAYDAETQARKDYYSAQESALDDALSKQLDNMDSAYSAQSDVLNASLDAAKNQLSALEALQSDIKSSYEKLLSSHDDYSSLIMNSALQTMYSALSSAKMGGSLTQVSGLSDALSTVSGLSSDGYSSFDAFSKAQGEAANALYMLDQLAGDQISVQEQVVNAIDASVTALETQHDLDRKQAQEAANTQKSLLEQQMDAEQASADAIYQQQIAAATQQYELSVSELNQQMAWAQAQVDAINGVNSSVISVESAISALSSALSSYQAAQASSSGGGGGGSTVDQGTNFDSFIEGVRTDTVQSLYETVLGRAADSEGLDYWVSQIASGWQPDYTQFAQFTATGSTNTQDYNAATNYLHINGYANGSDNASGLYLAGERGPELIVSGPARVNTAAQTAALLSGNGTATAEEVRALRTQINDTNQLLKRLVKSNSGIESGIRQQNAIGIPEQV